jgi:hypothetical protein
VRRDIGPSAERMDSDRYDWLSRRRGIAAGRELGAMAKGETDETYIRRARSARVRQQLAPAGSPEWLEAQEDERLALDGLRKSFGVVDQATLDWLLERKVTSQAR